MSVKMLRILSTLFYVCASSKVIKTHTYVVDHTFSHSVLSMALRIQIKIQDLCSAQWPEDSYGPSKMTYTSNSTPVPLVASIKLFTVTSPVQNGQHYDAHVCSYMHVPQHEFFIRLMAFAVLRWVSQSLMDSKPSLWS